MSKTFDFDWPDWVPVELQESIASFWSCHGGAGPWIEMTVHDRCQPELGTRVSARTDAGEWTSGRWVPAWNNMGRVVDDDGKVHYFGDFQIGKPPPPGFWLSPAAREALDA